MTPGLTDLPDRQFSATKYSHALLFYFFSIYLFLSLGSRLMILSIIPMCCRS